MKNSPAKIMMLFLIALLTMSVSAQSSETEDQIGNEIQSILELDLNDDDAMRKAVGKQFLQCAALYDAMAIELADSRPATAILFNEKKNFHLVAGQALYTELGMPLSSKTSFVNAYVETYRLIDLPKLTEAELDSKFEWCNSDSMQNRGKEIISDLEKSLEQVAK